jgi:hypothetical protein
VNACVLIYCYCLPAIDSNENECTEEREIFEFQEEEDLGQANQGKPSKLVAYLILVLLNASFINVCKNAWFYIAIVSR